MKRNRLKSITSCLMVALTFPVNAQNHETGTENTTVETIVVTANAGQGIALIDAPATISVIDVQEQSQYQMNADIGDLIADIPGVNVSSQANGSRAVRIRGLSNDYTQVLLNGQRNYSREALWRGSDNALSITPSVAVESIEVIRGPMSTLYGADTMGGVVNVITRKNSGNPEGSFSAEGQRHQGDKGGNGQIYGLYYSMPINDAISYTVYGSYLDIKESFYPQATDFTKRRAQENYNLVNTFDFAINDTHSLSLEAQLSNEQQLGSAMWGGRRFEQERKMQRYNLGYGYHNYDVSVEANLHYSDFDVAYDVASSDIREKNYGVDGKTVIALGQHDLAIGAESRKAEVENDRFSGGLANRTTSAGFIETDLEVAQNTRLILGARYDHDSLFDGELTYRGYLNHHFTNSWSMKAGVGTAFKAPTMAQISPSYTAPGCGGKCVVYGNPDLKAETGTFSELGAYFNHHATSANITVFYNHVDNIIQQVRQSSGDFTFVNVDKAALKGLELYAQHQFDHVGFDISYTYLDAKDDISGERLVGTSKHEATVKTTWFMTDSTDLFARLHYRSEVRGELGNNDIAGVYTTLDLGLRYRHNNDIDIKFGINNLTDKDISSPETYTEVIQGRTVYAGLTYQF